MSVIKVDYGTISGGSAIEAEISGYAYSTTYYFVILNTKTGEVKSANINYASGTPSELSGNLLKVERTGSHTFKWTALNDAYLYKLGYNTSGSGGENIESYGQNGTYTSASTYSASVTMIATTEPLSY